jgi:uncharacterized protein YpmB
MQRPELKESFCYEANRALEIAHIAEIFGSDSLTQGQFVKKHTEQTGKEIAQAKRDLKAMYDFEIVIEKDKLYSLNGLVNNMENAIAVSGCPPF